MKRLDALELVQLKESFTMKVIHKNEEYKEENVKQRKMKTKVLEFYGDADPKILMEWIEDMQYYFDLHGVEGYQWVKISHDGLRNHAYEWWKLLMMDIMHRGKDKIKTWEKMVIKLRGKYANFEYTLRMCIRLELLKHNGRSVESYFEQFCRMAMKTGFVLDSQEKII